MNALFVKKADYVSDYKIRIYFNDGTQRVLDFEKYLFEHENVYPEYRKLEKFKTFRIDQGELVWGKNWDIIFPVHKLHSGNLFSKKSGNAKPYLSIEV